MVFFLVITGFIIWSWLGLWAPGREQIAKKSTSKTKVNYSVESVGHGELVLFCKFFTAAREYTPLTIVIVSWDMGPGELSILTRHRGGGDGEGEGEGVLWPDSKSLG